MLNLFQHPTRKGYPLYRQFVAKHVFYLACEMPICIGMTVILFLPIVNFKTY